MKFLLFHFYQGQGIDYDNSGFNPSLVIPEALPSDGIAVAGTVIGQLNIDLNGVERKGI